MIYLIHFARPLKHAKHYMGYCSDEPGAFEARMDRHKKGNGSKLMRAVGLAGIKWKVVRTWPDASRDDERRLKNRKNAPHMCPVCKGEIEWTKCV